jgi:phosphatidylethanolamine/phosphatidyl-N-methylethanolamine N-methyltransferase
MLRLCRQRMAEQGRKNVSISQGNALQLPFGDDTFDQVFISHVISVVSDPVMLVREAQRVAKPGARILILNHFQSSNRFIALLEKWTCPFWEKIGWRSDLALQDVIRDTHLEIDYRFKLGNIDLWETVVTTNNKSALQPA